MKKLAFLVLFALGFSTLSFAPVIPREGSKSKTPTLKKDTRSLRESPMKQRKELKGKFLIIK